MTSAKSSNSLRSAIMRSKTLWLRSAGVVALGLSAVLAGSPAFAQSNNTPIAQPAGGAANYYTYNLTATASNEILSFTFRNDPSYTNLADISLVNSNNANILANGNFSQGTYTSNGVNLPTYWYGIGQVGLQAAGTLTAGCGPNGLNCWRDGAVGGHDGIAENLYGLTIGDTYTLKFYLSSNPANNGSTVDTSVYFGTALPAGIMATSTPPNSITPTNPGASNQIGSTVAPDFQGGVLTIVPSATNVSANLNIGLPIGNTIDAAGNHTVLSGTLTGAGSLAFIDSANIGSTIVLTNGGGNTYAGTTNINGAILQAGAVNVFSPNSAVVLANAANSTLDLNGFNQTINGLSGGGAIGGNVLLSANLTNTGGGIFAGVISGNGSYTQAAGNQTFTNVNTYTGRTVINGGATLALSGTGSIANSGVTANGTLDISGTTNGASVTGVSGNGHVLLGGQALTLSNANDTFNGVIADGGVAGGTSGSLVVGQGNQILESANTYTGTTTINAGAGLTLTGAGSIAASSGVIANGTLDISGTTNGAALTTLNGNGQTLLGSKNLNLTNASGSFSGTLSDGGVAGGTGGSLTISGGNLTLLGSNSYTGTTTIGASGTLALAGNGQLAGTQGVINNGAFDISGAASGISIKDLGGTGTTSLGGNNLTLTAANSTISGAISDGGIAGGTGGSLTIANGTATLTGTNTYTGPTTVNAGATLALAGNGSIASSAVVNNGGLDISGTTNGASILDLSGNGNGYLGSKTLTVTNANSTFGGNLSDGGIAGGTGGNLTVAGGALTLTGVNSYTGVTTVNAGATLALNGQGAISASVGVANNGTFDISGTTNGASIGGLIGSGNVSLGGQTLTVTNSLGTLTGVISDGGIAGGTGGSLVIAGRQTSLAGVNTYTGQTTVDAGATLALIGSGSIASSSGVVNNGSLDISGTANGATIATLSGNGTAHLGGQTLTLANAAGTFAGTIADSGVFGGGGGSLTIAGGQETLTGTNTFTGTATVNRGATLLLTGNGSIANAAGVIANGGLDISGTTNGAAITTLSGSGNGYLGSQTLTLGQAQGVFAGVLADGGAAGGTGGSLTLGGGTETLKGANTYTGVTTINAAAALVLAGNGSIEASSGVANNGTLDISGTANGANIDSLTGTGNGLLGGQTLTLTNAQGVFAGVLSDSGMAGGSGGSLTIAGGTATLSGGNIYTGLTTINSGATLALTGTGAINNSSGVVLNGGMDISGTTNGASITTLSGNGNGYLGGQTLNLTAANDTFSGTLSDGGMAGGTGGSLNVSGGSETLSGTNTYTGTTAVALGANLALAGSGSIANSAGVTNNGSFDISQTQNGASIATLAGAGTTYLGNQTLTLTNANDTYTGVLSDGGVTGSSGGSLVIANGTETLTGTNTYTGTTTINSGASLLLVGNGSIATSASVIANGGLDISGTAGGASLVSLAGNGNGFLGSQTLTLTGANDTFAGSLGDGGASGGAGGNLAIAGGVEVLTGVNTYTGGTTVAQGAELMLAGSGSIATSQGITVAGALDISGTTNGATVNTIAGNGLVNLGNQILTVANGSTTFGGVMSGAGGLTLGAGALTLTGNNTYTGATTVASGAALTIGDGAMSGAIAGPVTDNGTLTFNRADLVTIANPISGTGALIQNGTGTLLLTGTNTVSGPVSIAYGTLQIGNAAAPTASLDASAGGVVVGATATLTGNGSVKGAVGNINGGTVKPGANGAGTLTVGAYAQSANSNLAIELTPTQASTLQVAGPALLDGTINVTLDPGTYHSHVYQVVTAGSITGTFATTNLAGASVNGLLYGLDYTSTPNTVNFVLASTTSSSVYGNAMQSELNGADTFAQTLLTHDKNCSELTSVENRQACGANGLWMRALGSLGRTHGSNTASGYNLDQSGFIGGIDRSIADGIDLGVSFGWIHNGTTALGYAATSKGDQFDTGVYTSINLGRLKINADGFYGTSKTTVVRDTLGGGNAYASFLGHGYGASLRISAPINDGVVTPFGEVRYTHQYHDGFVEYGAGALNFAINDQSRENAHGVAGLRFTQPYGFGDTIVTPSLEVAVDQLFGKIDRSVSGSLENVTNTPFTATSVMPSRTSADVRFELVVKVSPMVELYSDVGAHLSGNYTTETATGGLRLRF